VRLSRSGRISAGLDPRVRQLHFDGDEISVGRNGNSHLEPLRDLRPKPEDPVRVFVIHAGLPEDHLVGRLAVKGKASAAGYNQYG